MGEGFARKRAAVVGLGVSNLAVARFLLGRGASVTVYDEKTAEALGERHRALAAEPVAWRLGPAYLEDLEEQALVGGFDLVFLTPGMRKDLPAIAAAIRAGIPIDSEMGLFFRHCRAPIVGITGSAGKTTTTTLTGLVLARTGRRVHVGGNIGEPLLGRIEEIRAKDLVVIEISSFQLQMLSVSPHVGVLLNVRPNHLDIHSSFDEYVAAKRNIFRFQGAGDFAVVNAADPVAVAAAGDSPGRVCGFARGREVARGGFVDRGEIVLRGPFPVPGTAEGVVGPVAEIPIPGAHNVDNVLAALVVGALHGVPGPDMWGVVRGFRGVEHRLEPAGERGGVRFVNDSIATAPDRTMAALESFAEPLVLIAGGYDKKIPFADLGARIAARVRVVVLLGATADKIEAAVVAACDGRGPLILRAAGLDEAVRLAAAHARPGEVVLLSPACASYDMFRNYEERGCLFKRLVADLP